MGKYEKQRTKKKDPEKQNADSNKFHKNRNRTTFEVAQNIDYRLIVSNLKNTREDKNVFKINKIKFSDQE